MVDFTAVCIRCSIDNRRVMLIRVLDPNTGDAWLCLRCLPIETADDERLR